MDVDMYNSRKMVVVLSERACTNKILQFLTGGAG